MKCVTFLFTFAALVVAISTEKSNEQEDALLRSLLAMEQQSDVSEQDMIQQLAKSEAWKALEQEEDVEQQGGNSENFLEAQHLDDAEIENAQGEEDLQNVEAEGSEEETAETQGCWYKRKIHYLTRVLQKYIRYYNHMRAKYLHMRRYMLHFKYKYIKMIRVINYCRRIFG